MSSHVTDSAVEQRIGPYGVKRVLGRGTLSTVYEVQQEGTYQLCVLTLFSLPQAFPVQKRFLARFARESAVLTKLRHPYILPVQDAGVHNGLPYLVNPAIRGSSVAKLLKQRGRLTPHQVLELLKRIADSIDYAHSNGIVHGTLSPTNILLHESMQIAGFGLMSLLTMQGLEDGLETLQPASRSIVDTTLGTQGYIAPEASQGKPFDKRIDIYALGALSLELLSGSSPISGIDSSSLNMRNLATLRPELPAGLNAVIQQALEPNPAHRIQSAGSFIASFTQALQAQEHVVSQPTAPMKVLPDTQVTLPNAVDWFKEEKTPSGKWQLIPPITAHTAALHPKPMSGEMVQGRKNTLVDDQTIDPFVWWSSMTAAQVAAQTPGTFTNTSTQQLHTSKRHIAAQKQQRRRVVAMLAGGGVVALGALGLGGAALAHVLQHPQSATTNVTSIATAVPTSTPAPTKPTAQPSPTAKPLQGSPTSQPTNRPVMQPTIQPTQPPVPTPTPPPSHTGTVIGSTGLATNSSRTFTNPTNGAGSVLIHLPNGNFVAYSNACTHEGVTVYYDAGSQKLRCPRHGAIFDPANGGVPVSGPNNGPLQGVTIRVNGDGTITTG